MCIDLLYCRAVKNLSVGVFALVAFLIGFTDRLNAQPVVRLDPGMTNVRIDHVGFRHCELPPKSLWDSSADEGRAISRTYRWLAPRVFSFPEGGGTKEADVRRGGYFDLWALFSETSPDTRHAVALEFKIESRDLTECYLSLGFNDCCVVFVDRQPVWSIVGGREHWLGENIVPISLRDGKAEVCLLLWKNQPWTEIPTDHFHNEWAVNASLCPTSEAAWATFTANNSHFLDTPIVKELGDLRFSTRLSGHNDIEIFNLKGEVVVTGKITEDNRLSVDQSTLRMASPFVGIIAMGRQIAEALIIEGNSSVDALLRQTLDGGFRQVPDWDAWKFRSEHLLKAEYRSSRNHWWARKVALAFGMVGLQSKFDPAASPFNAWKSAGVEFNSYLSEIDGTTQHYRALVGPPKNGQSRPLVIFMPGAPLPVRPFLESFVVADINETEQLARLANSNGVDILWPGNVDVDYGGDFARKWTDEALKAFQEKYPAVGYRPIYLVGFCSSGVAALGYAESYGGIDGIVLWSPLVKRWTYRWPEFDENWEPTLPQEVLAGESTDTNVAKLKTVPVFCLFDIDVNGHGDREGTRTFCDTLTKLGGSVSAHWIPNPDHFLQWGVRAGESYNEWLRWISENAPNAGPRLPRQGVSARNTIKDALLRGFVIERPTNKFEDAWLQRWAKKIVQYRGSMPDWERQRASTRVRISLQTSDAMISILRESLPPEAHLLRTEVLTGYTSLWMVQLKSGEPSSIEVMYCGKAEDSLLPDFDLFCEGCCKGVVWGYRSGAWQLLQQWQ